MRLSALVTDDEGWQGLALAIKIRREQLRLSQQELADRAGVNVGTVKQYERGVSHSRYPQSVTSVAVALGWSPDSPRRILAGGLPVLVAADDGRSTEQWLSDAPDLSKPERDAMLCVLRALRAKHEDTGRAGLRAVHSGPGQP